MSNRVILALLIATSLARADELSADEPLNVGRAIGEAQASEKGISVLPSGAGLPAGRGSSKEGRKIYLEKCAVCHGENGEGRADFVALVGGRGSLSSDTPLLTVGSYWPTATTIFDYVWRAMPYQAPGSVSANEVYALTAWILSANEIIDERAVLDRSSLLRVQMPNVNGFLSSAENE
jgi:cytochrome c